MHKSTEKKSLLKVPLRRGIPALMLMLLGSAIPLKSLADWIYTPSPMFGYDPATGYIIGGAFFTYPAHGSGWVTSSQIIYSTEGVIKLKLDYSKASTSSSLGYGAKLSIGQDMMRYFGEGGQTQVNQMVNVFSDDLQVKPFVEFWINKTKSWGFQIRTSSGYVTRVTDKKNNSIDKKHAEGPNEASSSVGLFYRQDSRNYDSSLTEGKFFQIEGNFVPNELSSLSSGQSVFQFLANYDQFIPFNSSNVFVYRLKMGTTLGGTPSFLYRYTLGGTGDIPSLRGYFSNRFRGNHFYGIQLENRITIVNRISAIVFLDTGDIANQSAQDFSYFKMGYGVGLRFGLPPDGSTKIRVDFGISKDQSTFVVGFNEVI